MGRVRFKVGDLVQVMRGAERVEKARGRVLKIFLAEGKKLDRLWNQVEAALAKVKIPQSRIEHLLTQKDPKLLAQLVGELTAR